MNAHLSDRAVIFGEVLFDCFPDGQMVMGGAPFNVAWHLKGFNKDPLLISCLGADEYSKKVLARMQAWGLDTRGIQQNKAYPTGQVEISLTPHGQPSFSILPDQAYDFIDSNQVKKIVSVQKIALLYHGTLAARNKSSMQALTYLRKQYHNNIFVDVNLRQPWWNQRLVKDLVQASRWVKLNDDELFTLSENKQQNINSLASAYKKNYSIKQLILTLGEKGALLCDESSIYKGTPVMVHKIMDTVGAGDAFSAIIILGVLNGWSAGLAMPRALEFAALICGQRGATLMDRNIYTELIHKWEAG